MMRECCRKQNINGSDSQSLIMNLRNLLCNEVNVRAGNRLSIKSEFCKIWSYLAGNWMTGLRGMCHSACKKFVLAVLFNTLECGFVGEPCRSPQRVHSLLQYLGLNLAPFALTSICKMRSALSPQCAGNNTLDYADGSWTLSKERDINETTVWLWFEWICHWFYVFRKLNINLHSRTTVWHYQKCEAYHTQGLFPLGGLEQLFS